MRRVATWAACVAWIVPEPGIGWVAVRSATGGCRRRRQHQPIRTATPTRNDRRRCFSHAPRAALQPSAIRLAADGTGDDKINSYGKHKRSSSSCSPLYTSSTANAAAASENPKAKTAKASAEAGKAAAALLLASSSKEANGGTTNASTLKRVKSSNDVLPPGAEAASITAASSSPPPVVLDARAKPGDVWRARLALTLVACLYGTNYSIIKFMGGFMETSSLMTFRFGLAALAMLPALRGVGKGVILAGAEVGVYATLGYGAQAYAMTSLPASELALLASLAVVVPPVADQISGRRQAGVATICAALLACGGAAMLQSGEIAVGAVDQAVGVLPHVLALMAPFFFGLTTWRMEAHVQTHPGKALTLTASQLVVVAVASALWGIVSGGFPLSIPPALASPGTDPWAWAVLVWLGLINTALVLFLETNSLESVSAAEATVIQSLEPLVGAGLASSTLGEPFPSPAGASLVLAGCLCSSLTDSNTLGDKAGQQKEL